MLRLDDLQEVCEILDSDGPSVQLVAGGLSSPRHRRPLLLDLRRVDALMEVNRDGDGLFRLGAGLALQELADDEQLRRRGRLLALACGGVGHLQWRRRVSLGGVVLRAGAGRSLAAALDCLEAMAVFRSQRGERRATLRAGDSPGIEEGEVLESIRFPLRQGRQLSLFHAEGDCSLALLANRHRDGRLSRIRMALKGGEPGPLEELARRMEALLADGVLSEETLREVGRGLRKGWASGSPDQVQAVAGRLQGALVLHVEHMEGLRRRQAQRSRRRRR